MADEPMLAAAGPFVLRPAGRIDTREELIGALTVAAQLEHALLAQYLYAALSLKKRPDDSCDPLQTEIARRWAASILRVSRDEMAHLAGVFNLLNAIGGAPIVDLPSIAEIAARQPAFAFELSGLDRPTIDRFVRFEAPEPPAAGGGALAIAPDPPDIDHIGVLYQQIDAAFVHLHEAVGAERLFCGPPVELGGWQLPAMAVETLDEARGVVERIRRDGEGAVAGDLGADSHWTRFRSIASEAESSRAWTDWQPSHPMLTDPRTRPWVTGTVLGGGGTRDVAELWNHCYATVLLMLTLYYLPAGETAAQRFGLRDNTRRAMSGVLRPLGDILVELPPVDGRHCGPPFETYGPIAPPASVAARWPVLLDRLEAEVEEANRLADAVEHPRLAFQAENLRLLRNRIAALAAGEEFEPSAGPRV